MSAAQEALQAISRSRSNTHTGTSSPSTSSYTQLYHGHSHANPIARDRQNRHSRRSSADRFQRRPDFSAAASSSSSYHLGVTEEHDARHAMTPSPAASAAAHLEAKVVILGSQGVGKTSLVHRYIMGEFSNTLTSTIGAGFLAKRIVMPDCKVR